MNSNDRTSDELFMGDRGSLPLDARRALVHLLRGPAIDGKRESLLWQALLKDEDAIRTRLGDLFLEIHVDREIEFAFVRQVRSDDQSFPPLLRRIPLTFLDSVLLVFLRQRLAEAASRGERAIVSAQDLLDHLGIYKRASNTDHAGFGKRCNATMSKLREHGILVPVPGPEDRLEISPVLRIIFSAEEVQKLVDAYARLAETGVVVAEDEAGIDPLGEADDD